MRKTMLAACGLAILLAASAQADLKELKPGWNLFSKEQDVQLGREAQDELIKKRPIVHNAQLQAYIARIGHILMRSPHAGAWPYEFHVVNDKNINAFSLPGGFIFVNTGAIDACENEAQLAGILAHEMSHVKLRHGTNQITKAAAVELPAMLAAALLGRSMLGQLAQAGIGLGANSVLLKFSRSNESEADYNGVEIMADVGYNPLEMAHFFEKLTADQKSGLAGRVAEFLSDHPNPGNRVEAIQDEVREVPRKQYVLTKTGQFPAMKAIAMKIAAPPKTPAQRAFSATEARPSTDFKEYRGDSFSLLYPGNWQVVNDGQDNVITIAPPSGIVQSPDGTSVGYGMQISYFAAQSRSGDLRRDTDALIDDLRRSNPDLRSERSEEIDVAGQNGLLNVMRNRSPFENETERDWVITVERPQGVFCLTFIAPGSEVDSVAEIVEKVVSSVRF